MRNIIAQQISSICNCEFSIGFIANSTFLCGCTDGEIIFEGNLLLADEISKDSIRQYQLQLCSRYLERSKLILNQEEYKVDCSEIVMDKFGSLQCNSSKVDGQRTDSKSLSGKDINILVGIIVSATVITIIVIVVVLTIGTQCRRYFLGVYRRNLGISPNSEMYVFFFCL